MPFYDRVKLTTATTGQGDIALGAAVPGYRTFAQANVPTDTLVPYTIEDGNAFEIGRGQYTAATGKLVRTSIQSTSNGNTSPINLSGNAVLFLTALSADLTQLVDDIAGKQDALPPGSVAEFLDGSGNFRVPPRGSTIRVGYGEPGVTEFNEGVPGDYYLDAQGRNLYGPRNGVQYTPILLHLWGNIVPLDEGSAGGGGTASTTTMVQGRKLKLYIDSGAAPDTQIDFPGFYKALKAETFAITMGIFNPDPPQGAMIQVRKNGIDYVADVYDFQVGDYSGTVHLAAGDVLSIAVPNYYGGANNGFDYWLAMVRTS